MNFQYFLTLSLFLYSSLFSCQIIYLNGTSSVGKSTIAKALQEELIHEPYLVVSLDQVITMMPQKMNWQGKASELGFSWRETKDLQGNVSKVFVIGPYAKKIVGTLPMLVSFWASQGFYIIVDDVALSSYDVWRNALKGYNVLWVGLTAPLAILEKREYERGDRQIGQAKATIMKVHEGFKYDLFLDTHVLSTEEVVEKIKNARQLKSLNKSHESI
jgi:chloramphenicol 3-O phosphotransferase